MLNQKKIILCVFLFLSACGYHLRGDIDLPKGMENIYMASASSTLQQEMKKALKSSQGKLVSTEAEAGLIIKFASEEMTSQVTSLNTAGRANEFQLIYRLAFSLYEPSGKPLLTEQNINIKREYFNDQTDILGKSNEEKVIRTEMYQQAVNSIMSRISVAMEAKTKAQAQ
jgi:LPS-assembly lipoprotein